MQKQVVGSRPTVYAELLDVGGGIFLHEVKDVGDLKGDAVESGAGEMGGGGAAGDAGDRAAGVLVPVRRAEAGEGGDDVDAAAVGDAGGELFDLGGGGEKLETIAEPLDDGAADEDAAFEGVFG